MNKKVLGASLLSGLAVALSAFSFDFLSSPFLAKAEGETLNAEVTGIEVRSSAAGDGYDFIVLKNSMYSAVTADKPVSNPGDYNTREKVKVYTSEEQAEGTYLTDICSSGWWTQNLWGSGGLMLKVNDYSAYNGTTIYKITIEAGCDLPCDGAKYVTTKEATYINSDFGKESAKNSAFQWDKYVPITKMPISLSGIQMRGFVNGYYYYLVLQSDSYAGLSKTDGDFSPSYTTFDKIRLFTSESDETGIPLSDLTIQHVERNFSDWTQGLFINFAEYDSLYGGHQVYKVRIEEGCELLASMGEDGVNLFTVDRDYTFYNSSYGYAKDKLSALEWTEKAPLDVQYQNVSISGVQARGWSNNDWYQYLVLRSDAFEGLPKAETVASWKRYFSEDKIRVYLKDGDGNISSVALSDLTVKHVGANFWDTGCYINYAEFANAYNGQTIYKVEILEGCLLPAGEKDGKLLVFKVDNNYTYFNNSHGKEDKKFENFDFSSTELPSNVYSSGTIRVETVTNQCGDSRYLILRLNEALGSSVNVAFYESKGFSNILDKVMLYSGNDLTEAPVALRDVWTGEINLRQYGSPNDIGFSIKNEEKWNGTNLYAVKILEGCEIPFVQNGVFSKKTIDSSIGFINTYYGLSGDIPGSYDDEYQTPRKYENFATEWARASLVSFEVEGLQNISFPSEFAIASSKIDASKFQVEGYELTITDDLGFTYYEEIIVPNSDTTMTLRYTKKSSSTEKKEEDSNIGLIVGCSVGGVALVGVSIALAILLKKKKA